MMNKNLMLSLSSTSRNMCGLLKKHKTDNPACIITDECNTTVEPFLPIYVEKVLFDTASSLCSTLLMN